MLHTISVPAAITAIQLSRPAPFEVQLNAVEVMQSDSSTEVQALDVDGEVIGTVALYALDSGGVMLSADFDDDYVDLTFDGERITSIDGDLDPATLEVRAWLMQAKLPSALVCTATVIAASGSCAAAVAAGSCVLVCPASVVVSICAGRGVIKRISGFDFSQCEMD